MCVLNGEIVDRGGRCIEISDKLSSVDWVPHPVRCSFLSATMRKS